MGQQTGDKRRSTYGYVVNDSMREAEAREWIELARKRESLGEAVGRGIAEFHQQRDAWRLFQAERQGSGGVTLDPVLRSHLGLP